MEKFYKKLWGFNKSYLIILFALSILLRFYKITEAFPFDFDQEVPAIAAYNFYKLHKFTIIGQELSFQGFFLGPFHNWIGFIPYGICNLKPECVPYFYTLLGSITIVTLYLILSKIIDKKIAILTTLFFSISFAAIGFERTVNSNFFLFPTSISLFYFLYKYFQFKNQYLIIGAFFCGLAIVNFNPIFIFTTIAFVLTSLIRNKKSIAVYLISFFAFAINYLPLFLFNFRHNNLIYNSLIQFLHTNSSSQFDLGRIGFIAYKIVLPLYANFFFQNTNIVVMLFTLALLIYGMKIALKEKESKPYYLFLPITVIVTFVGFIFYKLPIPEYYFLPTLLPMVILVSMALKRNKYLLILFFAIFLFINLEKAYFFSSPVNLKIKERVIDYVIKDTNGKSFKLYNEMPPGMNTGYDYLFKISNHQPTPGGENLYILNFKNPANFEMEKYYKTFPGEKINLKIIRSVEIVSVK